MTGLGMFYRGGGDNYHIHSCAFDGTAWRGGASVANQPGGIDPKSDAAPATCLYNNRVYVGYKGWTDDTIRLAVHDGRTWFGDAPVRDMAGGVDVRSNRAPALVVFDDLLHLFYKAHDGDQIRVAWFDGNRWTGDNAVAELTGGVNPRTDIAPCAVVFNEKLYLFYVGAGGNQLYSCWCDGRTWGGEKAIREQGGGVDPWSDDAPTAAVLGGRLFLAYRGAGSESIYLARFDGTQWSGDTEIGDEPGGISPKTDRAPNLIVHGGRLVLVYKGKYTDDIYLSWCDGTTWSGDVAFASQSGGLSPSSGDSPAFCLMPNPTPDPTPAPANEEIMRMYRKPMVAPVVPSGGKTGMATAGKSGMATVGAATVGEAKPLPAETPSAFADPLLCDIDIVGTHDSAAIRSWTAPLFNAALRNAFWACQNMTIGQQLALGIRFLDVRLEIVQDGGRFTIYTCHGGLGSADRLNRYQTLDSLLAECKAFLDVHYTEFVVMLLKVDNNWAGVTDRHAACAALADLLGRYPVITHKADMPRQSEARGKIYLFNRINDDPALGVPIGWSENTQGQWLPVTTHRNFEVHVQDRYERFTANSRQQKLTNFLDAATRKKPGAVVLNFASAVTAVYSGVYIHQPLISSLASQPNATRPRISGWSLFDFPDSAFVSDRYGALTVADLILDGARGYRRFPETFRLIGDGRSEIVLQHGYGH